MTLRLTNYAALDRFLARLRNLNQTAVVSDASANVG